MTSKKVYNPFNKQYWTKDNLKPDVKTAKAALLEAKEELNKIDWKEKSESQIKAEKIGNKISRIGWKLTFALTIPIILTLFIGVPGLIIGIIVAAFFFKKSK